MQHDLDERDMDKIGGFRFELEFVTPENLDWCAERVGRYRLNSQGVPDGVVVMKYYWRTLLELLIYWYVDVLTE